jgi:hypothetical protein
MTWRFVLRSTEATLASEWLLDEAGPDHPGENAEEQGTFPRAALKKTDPDDRPEAVHGSDSPAIRMRD